MSTASLFTVPSAHPRISFELFPPRTPAGESKLWGTVTELTGVAPDFFSVTYGANGATRDSSAALITRIIAETEVTPIAHLTCVGASEAELREVITALLEAGVRDFLALRGDPPAGQENWAPHPDGLNRAAELVALIRTVEREYFGEAPDGGSPLSISVATYPGGRRDSDGAPVANPDDIAALLEKQAAGADFAITQLFYDAGHYAELVAQARAAGVHIPILPGVIPLTDPRRLRRMVELTGVPAPADLLARLEATDDAEEQYAIGLAESVRLVRDVLEAGAPGLHVYTFNSSRAALDVLRGAGLRGRGGLLTAADVAAEAAQPR